MINKIEIVFALPIDLKDYEQRALVELIGNICKRACPYGMAFWPSGIGSRPNFSKMDARFLGKPIDPDAPETGEPTFNDSVFHIDCAARQLHPSETRA